MEETVRARCTVEFKQGAVRLVAKGHNVGTVAKSPGAVSQTPFQLGQGRASGQTQGR